ncbi:hypothetical protein IAU60_006557 [Kwoniella sp. DSM 27419]
MKSLRVDDTQEDESDEDINAAIALLQRQKAAKKAQRQASRAALKSPVVSSRVPLSPAIAPAPEPAGRNIYDQQDDVRNWFRNQNRGSSGQAFSPGYGLRDRQPGADRLPPEEQRLGAQGSVHRLYPAPSPIRPVVNKDEGWGDRNAITAPQSAGDTRHTFTPPDAQQETDLADRTTAPTSSRDSPNLFTESETTGQPSTAVTPVTAYVPWPTEGVQ